MRFCALSMRMRNFTAFLQGCYLQSSARFLNRRVFLCGELKTWRHQIDRGLGNYWLTACFGFLGILFLLLARPECQ